MPMTPRVGRAKRRDECSRFAALFIDIVDHVAFFSSGLMSSRKIIGTSFLNMIEIVSISLAVSLLFKRDVIDLSLRSAVGKVLASMPSGQKYTIRIQAAEFVCRIEDTIAIIHSFINRVCE